MGQRVLRSITGVALAAALAACGGGTHRSTTGPHPAAGDAAGAPAAVAVIRSWAQALARGDIAGAARLFATPSRFQIDPGLPVASVRTAAQARAVNLALPCGAKLLDARPAGRYIDALFLLGRRPGADCGPGVGGTGRVAFVIRAGKIVVWRRIADEPGDAARGVPGTPAGLPPASRII